jgi:multidrug efflux system membrane fusion protein
VAWADLRPVLDDEIARLPERYRVPFILCYLEGRTNGEAARQMGCPEGTVASRLAWARQRLRCRLTRRGVTLPAGFCAAVLSGKAALTPALAGYTVEAAGAFAGGARVAEPIAAKVSSLATEVLKHMFWTKARTAAGVLLAVCLLLGGGGSLVGSAGGNGRDGPAAAAGREVIVSRPLARELTEDEEFPGITGVDSVEVAPRLGGILSKVHFKDGAAVEQGQLLFEIDSRPLEAVLAQAEADLAQREGRLEQAEAHQEWAKKQLALKQIAPETVEKAGRDAVAAKADVAAAAAARDIARANLNRTRVKAPLAGRIYGRVDPGSVVRADDAVATIVSPGPAYVYFEAPLRLLPALAAVREGAGMPVAVGLAGEQGLPRRGTVGLAGARVDADKGTLRLRAVLPNDGIRSGQPARVRLATGRRYRALLVPQGAVRSERKEAFLFVVNARGEPERRRVELGPLHDGLRVVKGGLAPGDWVVLANPFEAQPGTAVSLRKVSLLEEGRSATLAVDEGDPVRAGQVIPTLDERSFHDDSRAAAFSSLARAANARTVFSRDNGLSMTLPLQHTSVAEVVRLVELVFREPKGRLVVGADERTNTLSVAGPTEQVLDVVKLVAGLEELARRNPKPAGRWLRGQREAYRVTFADVLREGARAGGGPRLGVTVEAVSPALADQLALSAGVGLLVTEVVPDSPAARVGVRAHDVLVKIGGAPVPADTDDFVKLIASLESDTPLDVVVVRQGRRQNLGPVRLADGPAPAEQRRAERSRARITEIQARIDVLVADVETMQDRVAWSERMFKKGFSTAQQVEAERARLRKTKEELKRAREELEAASSDPNKSLERWRDKPRE